MTRSFLLLLLVALPAAAVAEEPLDFNRDIRPILSNNCFLCHGPDEAERQGSGDGLRLDLEAEAKRLVDGTAAIVPGKPEASELVRRITSDDEFEVMPPRDSGKHLMPAQIAKLEQWIKQGAPYAEHWAWKKPKQVEPPAVRNAAWPRNAIDHFILARLEKEGLHPAAEADRLTLVRRLYLDLVGVPPSIAEADAFAADDSPEAYEHLVDKLLDSPQYGERWARRWLDLARYADTNGYEKDRVRSIWPYRDWVIKALNDDMPFDQFTIRQLAGDMLPGATQDDRVATGFHRNTMLNEEGGIDPLEFRFYAMVDRVSTTGSAWLGLTTGCAQCHTHKYDPLTHREYYGLMALLNNADEPEIELFTPELEAKRAEIEAKIGALEKDLPNRFAPEEVEWTTPAANVTTASEAKAEAADEGSWRIAGPTPETDTYTLTFDLPAGVDRLRLETLTDGTVGPGRTPHGNFVLSEIELSVGSSDSGEAAAVKLVRATADFSQNKFPVAHAIDGDAKTGWAVDGQGRKNRTATFHFEKPLAKPGRATLKLAQNYGGQHTIAHFRMRLGKPRPEESGAAGKRVAAFEKSLQQWIDKTAKDAVAWEVVRPTSATSNLPILTVLDDDSVFSSGDITKADTYELKFKPTTKKIAAIRLEGIPDPRLPRGGPGRVYYEGQNGDFALSDLRLEANGKSIAIADATQSFADGGHTAKKALDDDLQSVWGINGAQGKHVQAIFVLAEPLENADELTLRLHFERHYAAALGRFRISVTDDPNAFRCVRLPPDVNQALLTPAERRTREQREALLRQFVSQAPELAAARQEIEQLRTSIPKGPTTLVMQEWNGGHKRPTARYHRGEFLQPKELIEPGVPHFLPPMPEGAARNRLEFARWLVSRENPLTARVTVNRQWQAFFGRGLVPTMEDFGMQGELPSHPELLDYLAVHFMDDGWSLKRLHKLLVMSATYRQASNVSPALLQRDPGNVLLARGPRFRLEAEVIRDSALKGAGLLSGKMYGPSVFPPQPASITTEGAYGALAWNTSQGEDRYRRSLYTFAKRTQPFAMLNTFDSPTGEACIVRREASNSPLQGLTLLNDGMLLEAHQALGNRLAAAEGTPEEKRLRLFRECLTRHPSAEEQQALQRFADKVAERLARGELDAAKIAGPGETDRKEAALWTLVARALMNLDEAVTKN
jgi:mono/diheme cytochrome c family protein